MFLEIEIEIELQIEPEIESSLAILVPRGRDSTVGVDVLRIYLMNEENRLA
jgi:hypothetical protein